MPRFLCRRFLRLGWVFVPERSWRLLVSGDRQSEVRSASLTPVLYGMECRGISGMRLGLIEPEEVVKEVASKASHHFAPVFRIDDVAFFQKRHQTRTLKP